MGYINVFTGPIKCGKSQKIFNELKRQLIAGKSIKVFIPNIDTDNNNVISTMSGNCINALKINNIEELKKYNADVYFIDMFHFLDGDVSIIDEMATQGKKFYIAGLNLTADKRIFGKMGDLMCIADHIEIMTSICEVCKSDEASFSYCKGNKSKEYIPVCRECYNKLINKEITLKPKKSRKANSTSPTMGKILVNDFNYQYHF